MPNFMYLIKNKLRLRQDVSAGKVYLEAFDNGSWVQRAELDINGGQGWANQLIGAGDIKSEHIALGAIQHDHLDVSIQPEQVRADYTKPLIVEVSSSAPSNPVNGQIWYDLVNHKFHGYANGAWV